MEPNNIVLKWGRRNWPFVTTCAILAVGIGVLLVRSNDYTQPAAEAAIRTAPTSAIVAGEATIIKPTDRANAKLVSDNAH